MFARTFTRAIPMIKNMFWIFFFTPTWERLVACSASLELAIWHQQEPVFICLVIHPLPLTHSSLSLFETRSTAGKPAAQVTTYMVVFPPT